MHTASLELCHQLHELSGWDDDMLNHNTWYDDKSIVNNGVSTPRYPLGYLLRLLPVSLEFGYYKGNSGNPYSLQLRRNKSYWLCCYPVTDLQCSGDTPENAACKLAIELFKQGILTPDGEERV